MNKIEQKIKNLRTKLKKWNKEYYLNNNPSVDDAIYDNEMNELIALERQFPEFYDKDSPTIKLGGGVSSTFKKKKHNFRKMLSLKNAFNYDDLNHFDSQIKNILNNDYSFTVEPKIDGLSISITYENGKFIRALTRGNGIEGEDVTENVRQINSLPKEIKDKEKIDFRGEIYFSNKQFNLINNKRLKRNFFAFSNPRNAVSGTIRQLDVSVVKKRNPDIFFYSAINKYGDKWNSQWETLTNLRKWGFRINEKSRIVKNIKDAKKIIENIISKRDNLQYQIDGVVLKVNENNLHILIGETSKFPKWAIAYKMPAEIKSTKLLKIFPTVGRTGRITYNAKLKPVTLLGTNVKRATLHNSDYIKALDLREGDNVEIKKAGDIIPKVIGLIDDNLHKKRRKWVEPNYCPSCGEKLLRLKGEVDQYCVNNKNCPSRNFEKFIHFVSRDAMNIEGLSEKQLEKFINIGLIKSILDIYKIKKEDLIGLEGYQEKAINNLLSSIEKTKNNPLNQVIFALGIRHIGKKTSLDLANNFGTLENIINADYEKLLKQTDLGEVKSKSLINFFSNQGNINLLNDLKKIGIKMGFKKIKLNQNNKFFKKIVVISGTILGGTREEIKNKLMNMGAKVTSTISSSTDFLIAGKNASKKKLSLIESSKIIRVNHINEIK